MSPDTSQVLFRNEYEQELEDWLRRRFGYLCATYVGLEAMVFALELAWAFRPQALPEGAPRWSLAAIGLGTATVALLIVCRFFLVTRLKLQTRHEVLRAASSLILLLGAVSLASRVAGDWIYPPAGGNVYFALFFWHFTASLFLPWTPRESLRPLIPLLIAWDGYLLLTRFADEPASVVLHVVFNPGILIPGLAVCAWRLGRHTETFRARMIGKHFLSMRQEFMRARSVHESMFPSPYDDGHVRFDYTYTPMRELGGDFVHLNVSPDGLVHVTLIDVTGHGLTAALTVNRLYGEIERIRAESPRAQPGELVALLNRYIFLTMAGHQIYATALAVTVDPYLGQARWASAGHPPAFLRGANGVVKPLNATTIMLGILADDAFDANQQSVELSPGDIIILYTDGAYEARDRHGGRFGIERLRHVLLRQPPPRNWPQFVASMVAKHTAGRAEDDVLVASLTYQSRRRTSRAADTDADAIATASP